MEIYVAGCSLSWSERANSCYVLDGHILFDCGEGSSKNVVRRFGEKVISDVDWIFVSHLHVDHFFSINQFLTLNVIYEPKKENKLCVVGPKGLRKALYTIFTFSFKKQFKLEDYINIVEVDGNSEPIRIGEYEISFYDLNHCDFEDVGFVIDDGKQKLGYTGDSKFDDNLICMVENCDAVICDVSGMENSDKHMGVEGYDELKKRFKTKTFYAVHCNREVWNNVKKLKLNVLHEQCAYNFVDKKLVLNLDVKFVY